METKKVVFDLVDCREIQKSLYFFEREIFQELVFMRKCKTPKPLQSSLKGVLLALRATLYICNQILMYQVFPDELVKSDDHE